MNIKNNIVNYLYDKNYTICLYDDYLYVFKYLELEEFNDNALIIKIMNKKITIKGKDIRIIKITEEELLVKLKIEEIKYE